MTNIGFIGVGNMGNAIIKGIQKSQLPDVMIYAFDTDIKKAKKADVNLCDDEIDTTLISDYLFLCVKPQMCESLLKKIAVHIRPETVVVSIMAGISGEYLQETIHHIKTNDSFIISLAIPKTKVIQVMPNTPLMLGEGAVAMAQFAPTTSEELNFVSKLFSASGLVKIIPPDKMNEIIAINGSSPAFIYLFAKAFVENGCERGLDSQNAKELFAQSLIGSAKMITESGFSLDELIEQVSSPGGTTIAGLDKLYKEHFFETVKNACVACLQRAIDLGKKSN
jgi:pyrroline-5-carboxylate reductase